MGNKFISTIIPVTLFILLAGSIGLYSFQQIKEETTTPTAKPEEIVPSPKPLVTPLPTLIGQKTMQDLVADARADLAERLSISQSEITTNEVESITWNDSSLGCPEPGMMYLQVLIPGYRILLKAKGKVYDYRTSLQHIKPCN